jgi:hypothetical protein
MTWSEVVKENPWLAPAAGAAWVGISFATSGVRWGMGQGRPQDTPPLGID